MNLFELKSASSPLILSFPHSGTYVPDEIFNKFTDIGKQLSDTDWFLEELYLSVIEKIKPVVLYSNVSRYVVDLNRPPDNKSLYAGRPLLGVCPDKTFAGSDIYSNGNIPSDDEVAYRIDNYWKPYHLEIERQIERALNDFGYALIYDAHSIRSEVPRLFSDKLPDLNVGTNEGKSCSNAMSKTMMSVLSEAGYSSVLDERFIGGFITRHYGAPNNNVHAVQMEISKQNYMDEENIKFISSQAAELSDVLSAAIESMLGWANSKYSP
jgi:N-formylglutamate amidohydrolase